MPRILIETKKKVKKSKKPRVTQNDQNVIELRKLVNTLSDLENERKKVFRRIEEEKRLLMVKYGRLVGQTTEGGTTETFLYQPGFRYHSNGDPRGSRQRSAPNLSSQSSRHSLRSKVSKSNSCTSVDMKKHNDRQEPELRPKDFPCESIRHEIEETEKALKEIRNSKELYEINKRISNVKSTLSFLRAHSNDAEKRYIPYMSYNVFPERGNKEIRKPRTKKPNCIACEFNVKEKNEPKPKLSSDKPESHRWKHVPHGKYVPPQQSSDLPKRSSERLIDNWTASVQKVNDHSLRPVERGKAKTQRMPIGVNNPLELEYTQSLPETRPPGRRGHRYSPSEFEYSDPEIFNLSEVVPTRHQVPTGDHLDRDSRQHGDQYREGTNEKQHNSLILDPVASEDHYKMVMLMSSVHEEKTLSRLRDLLRPSYNGGQAVPDIASELRRRRSSAVNRSKLEMARSIERMKLQEQEKNQSNQIRVSSFLRQLPPPDVSIKRWRSSTGANMKHSSLYADPESEDAEVLSSLGSEDLASRMSSLDLMEDNAIKKYTRSVIP